MFSMGVIDVAIYALKTSTMAHVHFKAIGIMRLLVDNQGSIYCICVTCMNFHKVFL